MITIIVRHEIKDFDTWKRGYNEAEALRREHNVTSASTYRDAKNPKIVFAIHKFPNQSDVDAFMAAVPPMMEEAGVVGRPEVWIGEDINTHTSA